MDKICSREANNSAEEKRQISALQLAKAYPKGHQSTMRLTSILHIPTFRITIEILRLSGIKILRQTNKTDKQEENI